MNFTLARLVLNPEVFSKTASTGRNYSSYLLFTSHSHKRKFSAFALNPERETSGEEVLVVVGRGADGIYEAIRAKIVAPKLNILVIGKRKPLSKILAGHYPRGHKEFRGSFFNVHGPLDTMSWFSDHGVELKTEDDGRVFLVSNSSSSVIEFSCLKQSVRDVCLASH
ncbi:hypothetical protein Patl1_22090 [Pistacia atlantica]|uniref:Uncharacterized protein n=1 Tax=Pistacia atlantica TaxID=434234 RepID=A0ACC1BNN7_9ROSI|nr:hypothetical protein Patl1_22090 [Pistacia atlantica]